MPTDLTAPAAGSRPGVPRPPQRAAAEAGRGAARPGWQPGADPAAARRRRGGRPGRGHRARVTQSVTQHQLDRARASNAAITDVLAAPDARTETTQTTVGGTVTVVTSREEQDAVVITTRMPSLTPAQVYQLWVIGPAGARSAGLLPRTGQAGPVLATGVTSGDRIGITVEPSGGTSSPTTAPVIAIPVPA